MFKNTKTRWNLTLETDLENGGRRENQIKMTAENDTRKNHSQTKPFFASFFLLAIAIFFIVLGIFRDEVKILFNKAIRICLECVGLG